MKRVVLLLFLLFVLPISCAFAEHSPFGLHTVRTGDTLESVAKEHGIDSSNLAAANGIASADGLPAAGTILLVPRTAGDVLATLYEAKRRGLGAWPEPKYRDEFLEPLTGMDERDKETATPQQEIPKDQSDATDSPPATAPEASPAPAPAEAPAGDAAARSADRHKVAEGETPYGIARLYKIPLTSLLQANGLSESPVIKIGQILVIPADSTRAKQPEDPARPDAESPPVSPRPASPSIAPIKMIWPIKGGTPPVKTGTSFGEGLAVRASPGESVHAAADATVLHGGWMRNFGNAVYLNHGNGIATFYGGLGILYVKSGEKVGQGDRIALVGEGQDTEPKFIFHVLKEGKSVDPAPWLGQIQ
ncbi:MAG: LysM peptidoglycan-binding domain-containing protein [Synergistota bacterium]|nr:LysM peptidoglycan-binding domain-containing protein [Synergistota bacterium]